MAFLLTASGTIACSGEGASFSHQEMGSSAILRFNQDGDRLYVDKTYDRRPVAAHLSLQLLSLINGRCVLSARGLVLTAESNGRLVFATNPTDPNAQFVVISDEEFRHLQHLHGRRYFSTSNGRALKTSEVYLEPGFRIRWGDFSTDVADCLGQMVATQSCLTFCFDGWKVEVLRPYRPLIYFCAFGAEGIFSCLALACRSLLEIGRYDGEIMVITNLPVEQVEALLHFIPQACLHVFQIEAFDILDYTHARFRIGQFANIESYAPILYMDTDIICNLPVEHALGMLLQKQQICCASELAFDLSDEFYGRALCFEDPTPVPDNLGISSGFFGGANIEALNNVCHCVLRSSYGLAKARATRRAFAYMDQPVFNYILRKLKQFDLSLTDYVVALVGNLTGPHNDCERRGFLHFCGGVGNSWPKLVAMERYLDYLRANYEADES